MRKKIFLDELDSKSNELTSFCNNEIKNKIDELKNIMVDVKWSGKAYEAFIREYNNQIDEIFTINEKLKLLGKYLNTCNSNYKDTTIGLNKKWDNYMRDLR